MAEEISIDISGALNTDYAANAKKCIRLGKQFQFALQEWQNLNKDMERMSETSPTNWSIVATELGITHAEALTLRDLVSNAHANIGSATSSNDNLSKLLRQIRT